MTVDDGIGGHGGNNKDIKALIQFPSSNVRIVNIGEGKLEPLEKPAGPSLIRAGTQGLTCIIAPCGEIIAQVEPFTQGVAAAEIAPLRYRTTYSLYGDWPLLTLCAVLLILAFASARRAPTPSPE